MVDGIFLSQPKYATYLLAQFHMSDCKPSPMPFHSGVRLTIDRDNHRIDATLYFWLMGSLIYLTNNRPDISFAFNMVSRFM